MENKNNKQVQKQDKNKRKQPIKYVPVQENKEYTKVVLILKKEIIQEALKTMRTPLT